MLPRVTLRTRFNSSTGSRPNRVYRPTSPTMNGLYSANRSAMPSSRSASCSGVDSLGTCCVQKLAYSPVIATSFGFLKYRRTSPMDSTSG